MKKMTRKRHGELEVIIKGAANHRRIQILELLETESDLSVFDISERLGVDFRGISQHLQKLAFSGLVTKRHNANFVLHSLTPRGKSILVFYRTLE